MQVKSRIRVLCMCFFSSPPRHYHHASLSLSNPTPQLPQTQKRRREARGRGDPKLGLRGASLPLLGSPLLPSHRSLHRSLFQTPPLLPPPLPLSPSLQALLFFSTLTFTTSVPSPTHRAGSRSTHDDSGSDLRSEPDLVPDNAEVEHICKVIHDLLPSNDCEMESALTRCGIAPTQSLVVTIIHRFRHSHKLAYRFFRWAQSMPDFMHDPIIYNKMLRVLGGNRQFETLVDLLEEMGKLQLLSMESFKIAMHSFASSHEIKRCLWVFQLMKIFGFEMDLETFNCLLDDLAKQKLAKEAQMLFDKMSGQFPPDIKTYIALLAGWCKVKNLAAAGRVWNEMLDCGFRPDIVAHNIMLEGLINSQKRSDAMKLFDLMKSKGPSPNAQTYTIIIDALCKGRKMDLAFGVFEEMQVAGYHPDTTTYTCLLTGFGNAGQMDQVLILLKENEESGLVPDYCTYNAVIKLLTSHGMPEEVDRVYKNMVQRGFEPSIHTYNMIMKSFFSKKHEMGCQVWEEMRRKGICPDANSYTIFIAGHIQHGRVREAVRYILEMVNKGMKAPLVDYNKLFVEFCRAREHNKLEELVQKMRCDGNFEAADWLSRRIERVRARRGPT